MRKQWIRASFDGEGRCKYCSHVLTTSNTTVKKNHLLNIRACHAFLKSEAAELLQAQDEEVHEAIAALHGGSSTSHKATHYRQTTEKAREKEVELMKVLEAKKLECRLLEERNAALRAKMEALEQGGRV